ncbi:putative membrane protein [Agromyces sp. CF514]|uniref:PH domain-containing protein n=1 Tax=Agromyces sp. CF514 TaxID=1881031 RepID=UPI0008E73752|nr:PH domain-containing protein [Agromyces sp. CF514]SFR84348.1 putative membrane protein [Agromyces sp. CF514]
MTAPAAPVTALADGEWHRLHPASPLLRGGLVFIAVLGFVLANLRERLVDMFIFVFVPDAGDEFDGRYGDWQNDWANDPVGAIVVNGQVGWALLAVALVIIGVIVGFWLSWRMHTFRITHEAVEVRSGILFRSHRSARLDRVQGVNINRPVFARLFGTAKLDVSVAGESGNVQLAYLGSALADGLRADILRLASGARAAKSGTAASVAHRAPDAAAGPLADQPEADASGPPPASATRTAQASAVIGRRVDEFLAPELDPNLATPESVVHLSVARVIGSTLLGGTTISIIVFVAIIVTGVAAGQEWVILSFIPAVIGLVGYLWSRITKSLRYSIAGTPDGVRIGHGLLSTANQTIPPGRVHAVEATQWILWRPFGWWSVRVNLAGQGASASSEAVQRTMVLPVGRAEDVRRVLELLLPGAASEIDPVFAAGLTGRGATGGFSTTPRRAAWLRPFSWRRIGWSATGGVALFRRGALTRSLAVMPLARVQSVALSRGPVRRMLRLASVRVHTLAGPVTVELPVVDADEAALLFERLAADAVVWAGADESHHWGVARDRETEVAVSSGLGPDLVAPTIEARS